MDWLLLLPAAIGLIIACWPVGHHQWSYFFITVTFIVLIWEALSKWVWPEKKTISNVMRDERKKNPVRFWIIMTLWLLFSWSLIVHLAT